MLNRFSNIMPKPKMPSFCLDKNIRDSVIEIDESTGISSEALELKGQSDNIDDRSSTPYPQKEIKKQLIEDIEVENLIGKEDRSWEVEKLPHASERMKSLQETIFEPRDNSVSTKNKSEKLHEEQQYLNLIREIIDHGYNENGRNGNTLVKFGNYMRFTLRDGVVPILTTKKLAWRVCFEELFWFMRGSTSNHELIEKNVHIWDANGSRDFLDSRGLYFLEENDLGPIYGFQWRHFNADYTNCNKCYSGEGIDQLAEIIQNLKHPEKRSSRRLIMTAWNPCQINSMALPPCHVMAQFHVREGKYLSCALFQRSGDVGLGVPFNIASYSMMTHILAKHCNLEADEFVYFLGNCHIYKNHIEPLKTQLLREPKEFPRIKIANQYENIEQYSLEDIIWETKYESHPSIKMEMIA
jgi:thymidylate synthase